MLSCLSVGISDYINGNLGCISCATNDARAVYDAFKQIMGDEFNHYLSVCVSNILSDDFTSLLTVISNVIASSPAPTDQILVVYFSGHGAFDEQSLKLRFPYYTDRRDDAFLVDDFSRIFRKQNIKVLVILDCCYSGAALASANYDDLGPEISILASVGSYEPAKFGEDGSEFSKVLCKCIHEIERSGEIFSLSTLIEKIKANGYTKALVHRGAASEIDIVFRGQQTNDGFDQYFSELFIDRVMHSSMLSREAMWYSLNDFPDRRILEISMKYFDVDGRYGRDWPPEANWLVRRAIGSTLANHIAYPSIRILLNKLLESDYWQEQCIALIGLRYLMRTDSGICRHVIALVEEKKIYRVDAVWLAALYASDNETTDWSVFLDTTLALTPWGMIELCKAYKLFESDLCDKRLRNHCFYEELAAEKRRQTKTGCTTLERYVYGEETRGHLPVNSKVKFLLSALYGNWRDQILLNLRPYFECTDREQIISELEGFCNVCSAERKMALFSYLNRDYEVAMQYRDALKWGLSDPHPWVRRSAMEFYQELGTDDEVQKDSYFSAKFDEGYPGLLDFYLTCPVSLRQDLIYHLEGVRGLSQGDLLSLEQSFLHE